MRYTTVIFDLDGTLIDTLDDLRNAVNHALSTKGLPPRTREEINAFVGNGMGLLVRRAAGEGKSEEEYAELLSAFHGYYDAHIRDRTLPYPGIPELLGELKARGLRTGVVSNKRDAAARELCAYFFGDSLDAVTGEIEGLPRKPDPALVRRVIDMLGADPTSCVYVGDSQVDVLTARNAGLPLIAVTWGFRDRKTLSEAGATVFIDRPEELPGCLEDRS